VSKKVCDFCSGEPEWIFPATDFYDEASDAQSTGDWLACEACAGLVCREDWETLALRVPPLIAQTLEELGPELGLECAEILLLWTLDFHRQFREHRTGEPVRIVKEASAHD
jgi:hypothetical protein